MAFWSDFLKVMKSTVFKNVLKNGDYSVKKLTNKRYISTDLGSESGGSFDGSSDVNIGVKNTLPIKHGGTGATDASTAREKLGAVSKSGDTMGGKLYLSNGSGVIGSDNSWTSYGFFNNDKKLRGSLMISDKNEIHFNVQKTGATAADRYLLPKPTDGLTKDDWHVILTDKQPVTIEQGGTGATSADDALTNLGVYKSKRVYFSSRKVVNDIYAKICDLPKGAKLSDITGFSFMISDEDKWDGAYSQFYGSHFPINLDVTKSLVLCRLMYNRATPQFVGNAHVYLKVENGALYANINGFHSMCISNDLGTPNTVQSGFDVIFKDKYILSAIVYF